MTTQKNDTRLSSDIDTMNAFTNTPNYAAGKEGETIAENNEEDNDAVITKTELDLLDNAGTEKGQDDINEANAQLDKDDEDGDALNEGSDLTGEDLDVPGADLDVPGADLDVPGADLDDDEMIGEEDEENNSYSDADQGDQ